MIILPAIDILNGNCVRLVRGEYGTAEKVASDPFETVDMFKKCGAEYIHLVDLDGAKDAVPVNNKLICALAAYSGIPCEVGGGIRTSDTIDYYINNGISRIILGSAALRNPELVRDATARYGDKIAVGIDAKNGMVSTSGWLETSQTFFTDFAKVMENAGVGNIIFTDIARDGTLEGPALELLAELKNAVGENMKITASGGIKDLNDIKMLNSLNLYGAIAGKSIYSGTLNLADAIKYTKNPED